MINAKDKILATDLDGTLFYPKKMFRLVSRRNTKFIQKFIDANGKVLLVSGRNHFNLEKVARYFKRDGIDYSGCNGTFLTINHQMIYKDFMDNSKLKAFLNEIKDTKYYPTGVLLMDDDYSFIVPTKSFGWFNRFGFLIYSLFQGPRCEEAIRDDKLLFERIEHGKIFKVTLFYGITPRRMKQCREAYEYFRQKHPEYAFVFFKQCLEVTNVSSNKALAVKQYLDYFKINYDNVIVVGDSGNDVPMFQNFENSFCMKRALPNIKSIAKHQIKGVWEIEKYLSIKE